MIVINLKLNDKKKGLIFLSVKGHSEYDAKGRDIVCAGISAIINGSINFFQSNYTDYCKIKSSSIEITITQLQSNEEFELCLRMMMYQLRNISSYYPDHVLIEEDRYLSK